VSGAALRLVGERARAALGGASAVLGLVGGVILLLRDAARHAGPGLVSRKRGRRLAWRNLWAQLDRVGVRAVPIVALVVFCIGVILALQVAPILREFGSTDRLAGLISIAIFRELGPLVGAIVLTGFAGASIAAELGSMVVGEEVIALQTHAIHPTRFLVVPRVLATVVMTVCLAVVADVMGLVGGMSTAWLVLDVEPARYWADSLQALSLDDLVTGLIKAGVFGTLIGSLACYLGLSVSGGAEGVGNATTRTVVLTIVGLVLIDLLFTAVFYRFGM
jgi:phospholipid/cholesterol/gamma-HCH transport system permease protein